jgi:hypothetical protein
METLATTQIWFGQFSIPIGSSGHWRVGPLELVVEHAAGEWRVAQTRDSDAGDEEAFVHIEPTVSLASSPDTQRYVVSDPSPQLSVLPLLPDRAVITRPVSPVFVPANETIRLYVSMPVWLRLAAGREHKVLTEVPTQRLSDTWFGPNTREGELCYALRSRCRLALDDAEVQRHRALTPVRIRNRSTEVLVLERLKVPVRQLSLFAEPSGRLWTSEVALDRTDDGQSVALHIDVGPPLEARGASPIAGPREAVPKKTAMRAFSALFQ